MSGNRFSSLLFLPVMLLLLLLGPLPPLQASTVAPDELEAEKAEVEQGIKRYRINIRRLQQGIRKQQEEIKKTRKQERDLLAELQDIDTRLLDQKEKLRVLANRMDAQRDLLVVKRKELSRARAEKQAVQDHLMKRIQAYYKMGDIGFINVTFSAQTLPQLLKFHDSFRYLIKYDQNVIATYRHTIGELERSMETLEIEEALLQDFISQNEEEQHKLQLIRQEKESLLARIKTQAQLHAKAIEEMEQAAQSLSSSLQVLQRRDELLDQTFLQSKGTMPPPVTGTLIASFNQKITNRLGITAVSRGIAIDAPTGTMVRPIHQGTVMFAGYLRGYGNSIIVNHGYEYYSILSRLERLLVKKGQQVDESTEIGIMGDTATLMSDGLYLEVRHDSKPLDPLEWIDRTKLQEIGIPAD